MLHTPTSQPLFIRHKTAAELFEKEAAAIARMPDDDKRWPAQVLSELHKQLPFVSKYDVDIEMTRVEPEAGYALGYAMLRNKTGRTRAEEQLGKPTNKLRVPVIVADRLLQPFHVFEIGGKTYPLTQDRVESAMMNPAMFDGASDLPGTQSLLDQIYPPFQHRQGYGMMSGDRAAVGLSKLSSAPTNKTASGEPSPLREFLRQKEIEKTAIFTAAAVTKNVPAAAANFEKMVAKRVSGVIKPPVKAPPVVHTSPVPYHPPTVTATNKATGATRALTIDDAGRTLESAGRHHYSNVLPGRAVELPKPVRHLPGGTTLTDMPGANTLGGHTVNTPPKIDPRFTDLSGQLPPGRPGTGPLTAAPTAASAPAQATTTTAASKPPVDPPTVVDAGRRGNAYAERPTVNPAADRATVVSGSGPAAGGASMQYPNTGPEGVLNRPEWTPGSLGRRPDLTNAQFELTEPTLPRARSGAPPASGGLAAKAEEIRAASPAAKATPEAPSSVSPAAERAATPSPATENAGAAAGAAPSRSIKVKRGRLRAKADQLQAGAAGGGPGAINPSGAAGAGTPAVDPAVHSYTMQQMGMPKDMSPEQFNIFASQAEHASKLTGKTVTPLDMYRHSLKGGEWALDRAARTAGSGLRGLGYGVMAGGIGLGLGGMAIANKAQDNY